MNKIIIIFLLIIFSVFLYQCSSPNEPRAAIVLIPELTLPTNGQTGVSLTQLFKWKNNANKFQISEHASFSTVVYSKDVSGTQHQLPGGVLQPQHWYYWRAGIISGTTTIWSNSFLFETGNE